MKLKTIHRNTLIVLILIASTIGLYYGWKLFWFLTDDAFITFRYASNSILGYGYTWNPPPFRPVEGYTSFLWLILLEGVWRIFNVLPPQSANIISLCFSFLTILLIAFAVMKMQLSKSYRQLNLVFLILILFGTITNRTFLAWTSSGLETSLFNFCLILWIIITVFGKHQSVYWVFGIISSSVLVYLSRPDGILVVLCTIVLTVLWFYHNIRNRCFSKRWLGMVSPLMMILFHLIWRRIYYGEWLPNTYYAKHVAAWPEAGVRYFTSFILEYSVWIWFLLLFCVFFIRLKHVFNKRVKTSPDLNKGVKTLALRITTPNRQLCIIAVVMTVIAHFVYYTLIIGGDHFEYRVYSHLVPLIFISFLWMLNATGMKPKVGILTFFLFIIISWPVQWTHWSLTKDLKTLRQTHLLQVPISDYFPSPLKWYGKMFDDLQSWLIEHHVCIRHQEHKVFYEHISSCYPPRPEQAPVAGCQYPVMTLTMVGVPGWVFERVAIIDAYGLNDYVIARHKVPSNRERVMAHDRSAPEGYLESFLPNVFMIGPGQVAIKQREIELTPEMIRANERYWIDKIVRGID